MCCQARLHRLWPHSDQPACNYLNSIAWVRSCWKGRGTSLTSESCCIWCMLCVLHERCIQRFRWLPGVLLQNISILVDPGKRFAVLFADFGESRSPTCTGICRHQLLISVRLQVCSLTGAAPVALVPWSGWSGCLHCIHGLRLIGNASCSGLVCQKQICCKKCGMAEEDFRQECMQGRGIATCLPLQGQGMYQMMCD